MTEAPFSVESHSMRILLFLLAAAAFAQTPDERLERLLSDGILIDTHVDTPWYVVDEAYDLGEEHGYYEADIPRLKRGHVGGVFFGIAVEPQNFPPHLWIPRALELIDAVHQQARRTRRISRSPIRPTTSAASIARVRSPSLMGVEGGHIIQNSMAVLRDYYRLGVRYMTLTHFKTNDWADSSGDVAVHNGLTPTAATSCAK